MATRTLDDVMNIFGHVSRYECQELIYWAGQFDRPIRALEVGHFMGRTTAAMLIGLPKGSTLVSVDHHKGDKHVKPSEIKEFLVNVEPFIDCGVYHEWVFEPFETSVPALPGWFDFMYYDATHTPEACDEFWRVASPLMPDRCRLLYDDADWKEMWRLGELAQAHGFKNRTRYEFRRGTKQQVDSTAYTMAVMER